MSDFIEAFTLMRQGKSVRRVDRWHATPAGVARAVHPAGSHPCLVLDLVDGQSVPYRPTQGDLFGEDWELIDS